jgi:tellurite resistance protein TehA-like permease
MLKKSDPHSSARAVIALLIVSLAFAMLYTFYRYRDNIVDSGNFKSFLFLAFVGCALLLSLLFLVNKPIPGKTSKKQKR